MCANKFVLAFSALVFLTGAAVADAPHSVGVLEFGPDNSLFVGDPLRGTIYAYTLPQSGPEPERDVAYNLLDFDEIVFDSLGISSKVSYRDLAVHPVSRVAYVSVSANVDGAEIGAVVSITRDGKVEMLDLEALPSSKFVLSTKADDNVTFWRDIPASSLTITDLDFTDGELFVSGVSAGEFASTLRRVPYPFDNEAISTSIEIYHAAHNQNETRAPTRLPLTVNLKRPLDHLSLAFRLRVVDASGAIVPGRVNLGVSEESWEFLPN